jgi:vacuolar protein sorting-associated protein 45
MKALLLDSVTTQIVSTVYSQTEILKNHVYLVQRIDRDSDNHQQHQQQQQNHLTAIVFVRPVPSVVDRVARELEDPRFESYRLYFSGMLPTGLLRKLAEADVKERVRMVREVTPTTCPSTRTSLRSSAA